MVTRGRYVDDADDISEQLTLDAMLTAGLGMGGGGSGHVGSARCPVVEYTKSAIDRDIALS